MAASTSTGSSRSFGYFFSNVAERGVVFGLQLHVGQLLAHGLAGVAALLGADELHDLLKGVGPLVGVTHLNPVCKFTQLLAIDWHVLVLWGCG